MKLNRSNVLNNCKGNMFSWKISSKPCMNLNQITEEKLQHRVITSHYGKCSRNTSNSYALSLPAKGIDHLASIVFAYFRQENTKNKNINIQNSRCMLNRIQY